MKSILKIIGLFIFIHLFIACNTSTEPEFSESYFPLKVGNIWYYSGFTHTPSESDTTKEITWEVTGTTTLGGNYYYEITITYLFLDIPPRKEYYMMQNNRLFVFDIEKNQQGLIADFNLEEGQKFKYFDHDVTIIEKTSTTIKLFYDHPQWIDEEYWLTFEKGVGLKMNFSVWGIGFVLIDKILK